MLSTELEGSCCDEERNERAKATEEEVDPLPGAFALGGPAVWSRHLPSSSVLGIRLELKQSLLIRSKAGTGRGERMVGRRGR